MKKNAFTLLEIAISITIFSLIAVYMYQAINTTLKTNDIYEQRYKEKERFVKVEELFYNDIFLQPDIYINANISNDGDFSIFRLQTKNSIHSTANPYVTYFVNDNSLFRIESHEFYDIPLTYATIENVKVDKLFSNITLFRIYEEDNSYLINYEQNDQLTTFLIVLPLRPKQINSTQTKTENNFWY